MEDLGTGTDKKSTSNVVWQMDLRPREYKLHVKTRILNKMSRLRNKFISYFDMYFCNIDYTNNNCKDHLVMFNYHFFLYRYSSIF